MKGITWFDMGPFPTFVACCTDETVFKRTIRRLGIQEEIPFLGRVRADATTHILISAKGQHCLILAIHPPGRRITKAQVAALLAHEASHAVASMRDELNNGRPFCEETEAYIIQYLVQRCLQCVYPRKKK